MTVFVEHERDSPGAFSMRLDAHMWWATGGCWADLVDARDTTMFHAQPRSGHERVSVGHQLR